MQDLRVLTVLGVWAASACAAPKVDFGMSARGYRANDYDKVAKRWTRTTTLHEGITQRLAVSGVLKSWDYRQAYLALVGERFALSLAEREQLQRQERGAADTYHELFVSVAMENKRWQDLDEPKSLWKLALVNDRGEELRPATVERVKRITPEIRQLYPFHTRFHQAYVVRFRKVLPDGRLLVGHDTKRVTFRVAGAVGRAELHWAQRL